MQSCWKLKAKKLRTNVNFYVVITYILENTQSQKLMPSALSFKLLALSSAYGAVVSLFTRYSS